MPFCGQERSITWIFYYPLNSGALCMAFWLCARLVWVTSSGHYWVVSLLTILVPWPCSWSLPAVVQLPSCRYFWPGYNHQEHHNIIYFQHIISRKEPILYIIWTKHWFNIKGNIIELYLFISWDIFHLCFLIYTINWHGWHRMLSYMHKIWWHTSHSH